MSKADEFKIEMTPEVAEKLAQNPELAEAMRMFSAGFRQALHAVETGQHKTIDDALEAILGCRPEKIDPETGEVIKGASMQADMEKEQS
ncbi:hypothetical protein EHM76_00220 [bacterium]|nr:MAG: hypothetical protein EHM76_00220 [bacterium]